MKKIIILLLISLCIADFSHAQNFSNIDSELQELINQKSNELISVNIIFKSQIKRESLHSRKQHFDNDDSRRESYLKEFKIFSEKEQADVLSILQAETRSNRVANIKCHWITNMINCETTADVIYQLSEHPDIEAIIYNKNEYMLFDDEAERVEPTRGMTENIKKVNADDVWTLGYTGKGVIVAVLDTGVNIEHADLKDHLWDGGSEYPNHGYNTMNNNHNVYDIDGHGTHCAGTICGDGTSGTQTGIAPDATLMCIKVLGDDGKGSLNAIMSGIEFAVENGADVLSLSLGSSFPSTHVSTLYRRTFTNLLEFNVIGVVAAGNDKDKMDKFPIPKNINAPANCPPAWIHPDQQAIAGGTSSVISIGAVDYYDNPTYFSSEGPVTWIGSEWEDYNYDKSKEIEDNWLCYDRNYFTDNIGFEGYISWAVMFPTEKLEQYEGGSITKLAVYDYNYHNGNIKIYQGGDNPDKGTLLHEQSYTLFGTNSLVEIELDTDILIDHTKNLWVALESEEGVAFPAAACPKTDDPNGRWIKYNGAWTDISDFDQNNTWIIRAFVDNVDNPIAKTSDNEDDNQFGLIRPDVCAPGFGIISTDNSNNNGYVSKSGTSMATPCVAGIVALMKEKDPYISPAKICEILETTAVKLSEKKNNKTGSGRVDALAAIGAMSYEKEAIIKFSSFSPTEIEAGTDNEISVVLANLGNSPTEKPFVLNISSDDQYCTLTNNTLTYEIIEPYKNATQSFTIKTDALTPDKHIIRITLSDEDESISETIRITVSNDCLSITKPTNISAKVKNNASIALSWEPVKYATSYNIYRNNEFLTNHKVYFYTDKDLEKNKEYCYTVTAVCNSNESDHSNKVCAKILEESIEEEIYSINIHPNPVENELSIETETNVKEISIYDIYGRLQDHKTVNQQVINVSNLNSGIYFIKIKTNDKEIIKRFIKK